VNNYFRRLRLAAAWQGQAQAQCHPTGFLLGHQSYGVGMLMDVVFIASFWALIPKQSARMRELRPVLGRYVVYN